MVKLHNQAKRAISCNPTGRGDVEELLIRNYEVLDRPVKRDLMSSNCTSPSDIQECIHELLRVLKHSPKWTHPLLKQQQSL